MCGSETRIDAEPTPNLRGKQMESLAAAAALIERAHELISVRDAHTITHTHTHTHTYTQS